MKDPRVVPLLIGDLEREDGWWRIQMISFFASEVFHLPIEFPEEIQGQLEPVTARVKEWWETSGQAYYEALEPTLSSHELPTLP